LSKYHPKRKRYKWFPSKISRGVRIGEKVVEDEGGGEGGGKKKKSALVRGGLSFGTKRALR